MFFTVDVLQGTASDILIRAEEIKRLRQRLNEIYSQHTGQSVDKIYEALDRDRFMSAQEAKDFGLIDRIETHAGSVPEKWINVSLVNTV